MLNSVPMNPSGEPLDCPDLIKDESEKPFRMVRFYYGERTGERFKAVAFDDFEEIEADLHENHLQKNSIDYLRIEL